MVEYKVVYNPIGASNRLSKAMVNRAKELGASWTGPRDRLEWDGWCSSTRIPRRHDLILVQVVEEFSNITQFEIYVVNGPYTIINHVGWEEVSTEDPRINPALDTE